MAELTQPRTRDQLAAIASVRWRIMRNTLRTTRGAFELVAQIWTGLWFAMLGLGGAVGFGLLGWQFVSSGRWEWLTLPLWLLFAFWQVFPLAATAFTDQPDTSFLARYPLRYRDYFVLRVAYGAVDVSTLVGSLCLFGLVTGVTITRPALFPLVLAAATLFWACNLLIEQMVFAWLERWLARRRTREVLAVVFFLVILSFNFIGPLMSGGRGFGSVWLARWLPVLLPIARWLPPSLPAVALTGHIPQALASLLVLAVWAAAAGTLLHRRLRAAFRGELLEDVGTPRRHKATVSRPTEASHPSLTLPFGAAGAVAQKELRVLFRSPMMFVPLVMPVLLLVLFRARAFNPGPHHGGQVQWAVSGYGFPIGVAYALLVLTNLVFNALGTEASGVQFYFVSPASFRQIFLGKNIAYGLVLAGETAAIYIAALLITGPPAVMIVILTVVGLVFAAICDFTCGNLLSLFLPKKLDLARLGRQNRGATGLAAVAMQAFIGGIIAMAVLTAVVLRRLWVAALLLLALALAAAAIYWALLTQLDRIALTRRETLISELSKA